jgi:hypothetical protein
MFIKKMPRGIFLGILVWILHENVVWHFQNLSYLTPEKSKDSYYPETKKTACNAQTTGLIRAYGSIIKAYGSIILVSILLNRIFISTFVWHGIGQKYAWKKCCHSILKPILCTMLRKDVFVCERQMWHSRILYFPFLKLRLCRQVSEK